MWSRCGVTVGKTHSSGVCGVHLDMGAVSAFSVLGQKRTQSFSGSCWMYCFAECGMKLSFCCRCLRHDTRSSITITLSAQVQVCGTYFDVEAYLLDVSLLLADTTQHTLKISGFAVLSAHYHLRLTSVYSIDDAQRVAIKPSDLIFDENGSSLSGDDDWEGAATSASTPPKSCR